MTDSILPRHGETALLVVDAQSRLLEAMSRRDHVVARIMILLELAATFHWPVVYCEQNPDRLGPTEPAILDRLGALAARRVAKLEFSCARNAEFASRILPTLPNHLVVAGIEAHICVLQTVADLQNRGHQTFIARDATTSRDLENWQNGLDLARSAGAVVSNVETLMFHALGRAGTDEFRRLAPLIR